MKTKLQLALVASSIVLHISSFGQGALTPPGAPSPTMKSLAQIEPRTPISSLPFTISNSGSYYLTGTVTGVSGTNGITVVANNVTVDLNGFSLLGAVGSLDGINIGGGSHIGCTNITLANGSISGWGRYGIDASVSWNAVLEEILISKNTNSAVNLGILSTVRHCNAFSNGSYGFIGGSALLEGCSANFNASDGYHVSTARVIDCFAQNNSGAGIWAYNGSYVSGCLSAYNFDSGIGLGIDSVAINNSCVGNNTANSSAEAGIYQFYGPGRIEGNHISYSTGVGIRVNAGQTKVVVVRNTTAGNIANAYSIPAGNDVGPWGQAATATSPWANIEN
jgi:hypothetical protein